MSHSPPHSLDTLIRHLHQRRGRERRGLALAEGVRLVEEALAARVRVRAAALAPALEATPRGQALASALRQRSERVEQRGDRELASLAATDHPQGVIAVIEPPRWRLDDLRLDVRSVVVVLDAVQDPGNVGTIVRTAWALGAAGLIALPGTAELTNPKVLRATMGGFFRLPAIAVKLEDATDWLRRQSVRVWVSARDGDHVTPAPADRPLALVVGNEGAGVRDELRAAAERRIAIPLRPDAESLNVAVAAGILLYEVLRER
jgi:RNA methyltransferase, TrmH family